MAYLPKSKESFIEAGEQKAFPGRFKGPKQPRYGKRLFKHKRKQKKMEKVRTPKQLTTQPAGHAMQQREEHLTARPSQPRYQMGMDMNLAHNKKMQRDRNIMMRIRRATGG